MDLDYGVGILKAQANFYRVINNIQTDIAPVMLYNNHEDFFVTRDFANDEYEYRVSIYRFKVKNNA